MCGIAGVFSAFGGDRSRLVREMLDKIHHRGPDDLQYQQKDGCCIGHVRLAINGDHAQPVSDGYGMLALAGEIYNCPAGVSEASWILRGYHLREEWDGMFAIAHYEYESRTLMLIRDRYGIKPLYYTRIGRDFLFASEIKAFLAHPRFRADVDQEALEEYFTFQNYLDPATTLFRGVHMVRPGTALIIDESLNIVQREYWSWNFLDGGEAIPDFTQAVKSQLRGDFAPGCYLSGGLDSAMIAKRMPTGLTTFSVGFTGGDERADAEALAAALNTAHYEAIVTPQMARDCLPSLAWHLEEPRLGPSYPNWYAAALASRFGRVVMAGTGGDELFGGYPWRYGKDRAQIWTRLPPVLNQSVALERLRSIYSDTVNDWEFEARTFLHSLLVIEDKVSMAHSLEARVPFLSNAFVDQAIRIPFSLRTGRKDWMREEIDGLVPDLATKPKQGFCTDDTWWFPPDRADPVWSYLNDDAWIQTMATTGNRRRLLNWSLAYFNAWHRVWIEGERPQ